MSKFAIEPYVRIQGSGAAAKDIWATKSWITDSGNSFARLISRITVAFCNALETIISRPACHGCAAYPRLFLRLLQHQTSAAATLLHKSMPAVCIGTLQVGLIYRDKRSDWLTTGRCIRPDSPGLLRNPAAMLLPT